MEPAENPMDPAPGDETQARRDKIRKLKEELLGDMLTAAEVAEVLEVHPRTVGEYIREGRLNALPIGGGWRIPEQALREFVAGLAAAPSKGTRRSQQDKTTGGLFGRLSPISRRTIVMAQELSREWGHGYIGEEHLVGALLAQPGSRAARALAVVGVLPKPVRDALLEQVPRQQSKETGHIPFTRRAKRVMEMAVEVADSLDEQEVDTGHFLLAILKEFDGIGAKVLFSQGADEANVQQALAGLRDEPDES